MLITAKKLHLAYGMAPLLNGIDLTLQPKERVALIGRNGEGKSTLLKVLTRQETPDEGDLVYKDGIRTAILEQAVPETISGLVYDVVASGRKNVLDAVKEYEVLTSAEDFADNTNKQNRVDALMQLLESENGWDIRHEVEAVVERLSLDGEQIFEDLSGGKKRRVMLARALLNQPDVLFLDEPTNHLDIDSIAFLEEFLLTFNGSLFFISHDRKFIDKLATRIIELDRGKLAKFDGNYAYYLVKKEEQLAAEEKANSEFDKKLAQEETWIRQGIKARRTRNEGRVRALNAMREERGNRRDVGGKAKLAVSAGSRSGKKIVEAKDVSFRYPGDSDWIFTELDTLIMRGDKIGIIGANGAGKTTLIKVLLNQLQPTEGEIKHGHNLEIAYLDQLRSQLNEEQSIIDNVQKGSDFIEVNGRQKHIMSYLQDFLFSPKRARTPVKALSGGEKNRVLLAKLFTRPLNVLVLDEPTNDLDIETLELLESLLVEFNGTLLMISHDRVFLDNVVTNTLVFEKNRLGVPVINEYVGGYNDWLRQRLSPAGENKILSVQARGAKVDTNQSQHSNSDSSGTAAVVSTENNTTVKKKKLSYKEQRELDALPDLLETLEQRIDELNTALQQPEVFSEPIKAKELSDELSAAQQQLDDALARWAELES